MAKKPLKRKPKTTSKTRSDKGTHRKQATFEVYGFFLSLPSPERQEEFEFYTDKGFAKKYKVTSETLTAWKKDDALWEIRNEHMSAFKKHTADVLAALGRKALKRGDAFEVLTWMKLVEGYNEKTGLDITSKGKGLTLVDLIRDYGKEQKGNSKKTSK